MLLTVTMRSTLRHGQSFHNILLFLKSAALHPFRALAFSGMFEIYIYICFAVLPGFLYNLGMTLSSRDPGSCDGRVSSWYLVWMAEGRDVEV